MLNILRTRFAHALIFRAPDNGGGSGGGTQNPPANLTLEQQLSKARDDLAASNKEAERLKPFESQVATLTGERDNLQNQFNELTKTASETKAKLATAESALATANTKIGELESAATKSTDNTKRLEALCQVKGIDTNAAPTVVAENAGEKLTYAQWDGKLRAAKNDAERTTVMADLEAAVKAGNVAPEPAK